MRIVEIADDDIEPVVALWERCGLTRPWNDPRADIALARRTPTSTVLVGWAGEAIVAAAMAGSDGHRGWIYYLAVAADRRGTGLGRAMVAAAEAWLADQGARVIRLMVREENEAVTGFYRAAGYEESGMIVMGKRLG